MNALRAVDDVVDQLLSAVVVTDRHETVNLDDALGKYLYRDICSPVFVPPAANSAMDGYAINSNDRSIAVGGVYEVSDRIAAGSVGNTLKAGSLARIFTGAPMPEGADTVLIQEDTSQIGAKVRINELPVPGENVRPKGQDIKKGETILPAGHRLRPQDLGLVASVGIPKIEVFQPLKVAILSTGDELVEPAGQLTPGQIFNGNSYALAGLLREIGMEVVDLGLVEDTERATRDALTEGAAGSDCILSTGGVSVGDEDHVRAAVEALGSLDIWRLAIKPGKPLAFGNVKGTPFFGLPGNPVSTYVTFMIIARPYLIAAQGGGEPRARCYFGMADFDFLAGDRREYLRVRVSTDEKGEVVVRKFGNQGSGIMSSVSWANALAEVEIGRQVTVGDRIKYYLI